MRIVVLLSAGRDPRSGVARPVAVELQAIALALGVADEVIGLHAGMVDGAVLDALAHGLGAITVLRIGLTDDPLASLATEIGRSRPDIVLAGRRGNGGSDSGMLPYRLARACGWPIVADAMTIEPEGAVLGVTQALARGARRRVTVRLPAVVTVHEAAAPARAFVYRDRLRGVVAECAGIAIPFRSDGCEARPYRQRPKLIDEAGSRASRGQVMVEPSAAAAAVAILAYIEKIRAGDARRR